ncbi:SH3 domain-containing protein [Teredinibacter haidensis]|uniref:SH3 domain-containing protein n=1 Tax=Teredinibacter haidensis TaxID=2731755 RepID=UPI000948F111|nr:SH3 domain-containing protein [Teredinibacter haidensis]
MMFSANNKTRWLVIVLITSLLLPLQAQAKDKGVEVVVTDAFAEMHTGPGRGFPIFHTIEKGEKIRILKSRTDWYKVATEKGKKGWVYRDEFQNTLGLQGEMVDLSRPGREAFHKRRWELGVGGGDFSGARGLNTYLGFHLTQNISTELRYTQAFGSFSNSKMFALNAVHQPFPDWKVSPFFTLGTGNITISPSSDIVQTEDRDNGVLTVGGGFIFYVTRSFLFRLEYNDHTLLTKRGINEEVDEWKAGFSVFF